jgi:hypothetical protein
MEGVHGEELPTMHQRKVGGRRVVEIRGFTPVLQHVCATAQNILIWLI